MTELANPNKACCSPLIYEIPRIPPVVAEGYEPKGTYKAFGSFEKAYVTGSSGSGRAIINIYDAFGFNAQGIQGADILANLTNALVVIPDFFKGNAASHDLFPPKTDEDQAKIQDWFAKSGNFALHIDELDEAVEELRKSEGADVKIGSVGYCWGGKMATVYAKDASKLKGIACVHPGRVDANDATSLAVPIGLFPSADEPVEECEKFMKAMSEKPFASKNQYKHYHSVHHGFAAARGDLKDPEVKKQYTDVYERTAAFFNSVFED
ncbi:hypothetical protein FRB99_008218 [Tulasnella sp. 403]|nr:hypothetical protein FRB99_008218 [Tulasnella sp. 403]